MQNIHVERYDHPEKVGYEGLVRPEDGSWILFIPSDGTMPQLFVEVEVAAEDVVEGEVKPDTPTIKGYTPAIYLDDRVMVKEDAEPPCPNST